MRIGTCSWADEALSKFFYPKDIAAKERLAYYAERFDTVEVDSTYYRLPSESMVAGWAERTPPGFTMHVKAFAMMTRHPVKLEQLPPDLHLAPYEAVAAPRGVWAWRRGGVAVAVNLSDAAARFTLGGDVLLAAGGATARRLEPWSAAVVRS